MKSAVTMRVRVGDSELEVSGPKEFVEEKIDEFLKKSRQTVVTPSHQHSTSLAESVETTVRKMSLAQFFKKTSPQTDNDRVLLAAYFQKKCKMLRIPQRLKFETLLEMRSALRRRIPAMQ